MMTTTINNATINIEELKAMKVAELRALAGMVGVKPSKLNKTQLIEAIINAITSILEKNQDQPVAPVTVVKVDASKVFFNNKWWDDLAAYIVAKSRNRNGNNVFFKSNKYKGAYICKHSMLLNACKDWAKFHGSDTVNYAKCVNALKNNGYISVIAVTSGTREQKGLAVEVLGLNTEKASTNFSAYKEWYKNECIHN